MKVLIAVFLVLTLFYGIKMLNGESCIRQEYTFYKGGEIQPAITITDNNQVVLQHNPYNNDLKIKNFYLSFTYNSTAAIEAHIVNAAEEILAHVFIEEGFHQANYAIKFNDNETYNYIGLRCDNCDTKNTDITLYEEILGEEVERVVDINGVITITEDKTLDLVLRGYSSCWNSIKYFSVWLLTGIIFMIIIIGLIKGLSKTEEVLNND